MKKFIFIIVMLTSFKMEAQLIDSVKIYPNNGLSNDTIFTQIFYKRYNYDDHISRLTVTVIDDTIEVNTYWKYCGGYAIITHFDTIVKINPLNQGIYNFKFISCLDTNSANNFCLPVEEVDCYDTISQIYSVLQSTEEINNEAIINIKPNPFDDYIKVTFSEHYESGYIDLIDLYGRKLKTININNESEITIYRNGLQSGIYFLRIRLDGKYNLIKILVKN